MSEKRVYSKAYLGFALAVIFVANFLNYLDRTIVSGFEDKIKEVFHATPTQFGLLWTAFTVGYMLTSPFIGYFADRMQRTRIFGVCVLVWSAATVGCGLTDSFAVFVIFRVLIGVGEAGCLVIGPTLLSDYFPRAVRGRALSLFFLALPLGGAFGFLAAGQIGWPTAFYAAGLPGFVLAVVIFFLREPKRGASEGEGVTVAPPKASLRSYIELLRTRTLLYLILAQAFAVFTLIPLLHFGIGFLQTQGMEKKTVTILLAVIVLVGGPLGTFLAGYLGDKMRKKDPGAYSRLAGIGYAIALPSTIIGLQLVPHPLCYLFLFVSFTVIFACTPLLNTQIANVVHPGQRAVAFASAVFILHILGDTLSPPLFGFITTIKDDGGVLAFTVFPFSLMISAIFAFMARRTAKTDIAAVSLRLERDRTRVVEKPPENT